MDEPTQSLEIERKFEVAPDTLLPNLLEVDSIVNCEEGCEFHLRAEYFDTPDLTLARSGRALRHRTGGHDSGWHVKHRTTDGVQETQWSSHEAQTQGIPAAVLAFVSEFCDASLLDVIATISTVRRTTLLFKVNTEHPLAEVADDEVTATNVLSGTTQHWREWEVELLQPSRVDEGERFLDEIQRALESAGAVLSQHSSKLQRALGRA